MGGTFDPIHYGHLMLAEQIRTSFCLDRIIFIPVGTPSHKNALTGADKHCRLEMTKLATKSNPFFTVSDEEIKRMGNTYTIDTIKALKANQYKRDQLYFITGADAIMYLDKWKNYHELAQEVIFVAATRPGIDLRDLEAKIMRLKQDSGAEILTAYIPALAISSTDIRTRVNEEKSIKYLLPEEVENYIHLNQLYKTHHEKYDEMDQFLKNHLSAYRYEHSVETAKTARQLATIHHEDPLVCELAGLCHDYAKEISNEEMKKHIKTFQIDEDPCILETPNLAHGEVAAGLLKVNHGIDDERVLNAVRWHTYGHPQMSAIDKIVYIADIIEPTRLFLGIEDLRRLAKLDLDQTLSKYYLAYEKELIEKGKKIHCNTTLLKQVLDKRR